MILLIYVQAGMMATSDTRAVLLQLLPPAQVLHYPFTSDSVQCMLVMLNHHAMAMGPHAVI